MLRQKVIGTALVDIGSSQRLDLYAKEMREMDPSILYIMPSSSWLRAARQSNQPFMFGTFDDLAIRTLQMHKKAFLSLSEQERTLFFQQILEQEQARDNRSPKEKAKALSDTYGQLKRLGVSTDSITHPLEACKPIFKSYEKLTKEQQVLDPENRMLYAAELLKQQSTASNWHVIVDGFYDFSPLQFVLLEALLQADIKVTVYLPHFESLDIVTETLDDLKKMGFNTDRFKIQPTSPKTNRVSLIKATTTREQWTGVVQAMADQTDEVGILHAPDEKENWMRVAKEAGVPITLPITKKMGQTSIYMIVDFILKPLHTKEEEVELASLLLHIFGVRGTAYAKAMHQLQRSGTTGLEKVEESRQRIGQFDRNSYEGIVDYLHRLETVLDELAIAEWLDRQIKEMTQAGAIQDLLIEEKALQQLMDLLRTKRESFSQNQIGQFKVSASFIHDLVRANLDQKDLLREQGFRNGVPSLYWQNAAQFTGKTLFIPSMGAEQFPGTYRLSGYVQETDIYLYDIPYGKPTHLHFRKKQAAYFRQLFFVAEELVFSYVEGVDPNHPLLPTVFLDGQSIESSWSFENRMRKKMAHTRKEYIEMIAYWKGKKKSVQDLPADISAMEHSLHRLETGEEAISNEMEQRLKQQPTVAITALESYARCPIRFSLERLLQVSEPDAQDEGVSFLLIGHLVHTLIEWLYQELEIVGQPFSSLSEQKKQQVPQLIEQKIDESWLLIEEENPHISKLELNLLKQQWVNRLLEWWEAERKLFWDNESLGAMSIHSLEQSLTYELLSKSGEPIRLTGKIDRVDMIDSEFVIYDYKTGLSTLKMEEVRAGLKLQLPLYSYILKQTLDLRNDHAHEALGASYISLRAPSQRSNNGIWHEREIGKPSRFLVSSRCQNKEPEIGTESFLKKYELEERIQTLWQGMNSSFPVKPLDCRDSCPYGPICRVTDDQKEAAAEI
ncbi:PD-(D/E)XK nuclease family protein [Alkalicoccobacillus porphyridii]|uniref:Uncharacterized protein n=1 Tax=Alkalicoccobacillus porphyridii TaxID=2597270 RepID=A0A553ZXK4_9BACI|nr:PD-(D/E)XK nuclease family protein [Alkalicoccobacillus porphyridii]TSB46173.1 hypothetical protein FN960_12480 [Alkalicoccobacillus porphyridii]